MLERLRDPAMQIIQALKESQPVAMVQDYLATLENVYSSTDSCEDLYYHFCHTYQDSQPKMFLQEREA